MVYHILNGDSLAYSFQDAKIGGKIIVMRESLIAGDLYPEDHEDFWRSRANYMGITFTEYHKKILSEFEKIMNAPDLSEFNLWFEYDLFCQVNMWFVISMLNNLPIRKTVYVVYTSFLDRTSPQFWNGYGKANTADLNHAFTNRIRLNQVDIHLGQALWKAYKLHSLEQLTKLSRHQSSAYPFLGEVVKAHVDRFPRDGSKGRPEKVIEYIIQNISSDFNTVFTEFWKRESIYGFGDIQVKNLYDQITQSRH